MQIDKKIAPMTLFNTYKEFLLMQIRKLVGCPVLSNTYK